MNPLIQVLVLFCLDGDTCQVSQEVLPGRDRIRIANIDAPELHGKCPQETLLAQESKANLNALLRGQWVILSEVKPDFYPRRVDALITFHSLDIGLVQVNSRLARPWTGHREPWCGVLIP